MKKLIISIFLFVIAVFFTALFTIITLPLNWLYYFCTFRWKTGIVKISAYFYQMALSIDQFANVSLQNPMNLTMVKRKEDFHKFGDEDDTLSYIIAKNRGRKTLSKFGAMWGRFLNWVDTDEDGDHLEKAIKNKYKRDLEAYERLTGETYTK